MTRKGWRLRWWQRAYRYAHRIERWVGEHEEQALLRDEKYLASLEWSTTVGPP